MSSTNCTQDDFSMPQPVSKMGTIGHSIQLDSNMARLHLENEKLSIFVYVVQFSTIEHENIRHHVVQSFLSTSAFESTHHYTYDGYLLYLPTKLKSNRTKFKIVHPCTESDTSGKEEEKFIKGKIIYRGKSPLVRCFKLLKFLASSLPKFLGYQPFHRIFYDPATCRRIPLSDLEIFGACRVRLAQTENFPMLILDVTHCVRRTETISHIFNKMLEENKQIDGVDSKDLEKFKHYCLQKSIANDERNEVVQIGDVSWTLKDGAITPLLWIWTRANRILKKVENKNEEVCISVNASEYRTVATRKGSPITALEKTSMFDFLRISPDLRARSIIRFLKLTASNDKVQRMLSPWKISIVTDLVSTFGRVLPPPFIEFGGGTVKQASKVFWDTKMETANQKFFKTVDFNSWLVFGTKADETLGQKLVSSMTFEGRRFGLRVSRGTLVCVPCKKKQVITEAFVERMTRDISASVQFVIVILPDIPVNDSRDLYTNLKRFCLTKRIIISQMVNSKTLRIKSKNPRLWDVIVSSILSSVNCKLGAPLWSVQMPFSSDEKVMFVGMDVWHDNVKDSHSIGALVCSLDTRLNKIYSVAFRHEWHQEIFNNLYPSFLVALKAFVEENKQLPDRIIIYRDGVLRREYSQVLEHELVQFLDAIDTLYDGVRPLISLIIVQKRVYERFFAKGSQKGTYLNPPPGTVIDHDLTRKKCYDFFLISKYKSKGTVVPTHYVMIYDNSNLSPNTLHSITNAVCYSFFNWPGTFYVPSVVQYAHKLASFVGRCSVVPPAQLAKQLHFL